MALRQPFVKLNIDFQILTLYQYIPSAIVS
jgi:hypothetical protein